MCCIQLVTRQLYTELVTKLLVTSFAGSYKLVLRVRLVGLKREEKQKERENIVFLIWLKIENRGKRKQRSKVLTWAHKISSPQFGKEIKEKKKLQT